MPRLPELRPREIIAALRRAGFTEKEGTRHTLMVRRDRPRPVPIGRHPNPIGPIMLKKIIREAGLSEESFLELL